MATYQELLFWGTNAEWEVEGVGGSRSEEEMNPREQGDFRPLGFVKGMNSEENLSSTQ